MMAAVNTTLSVSELDFDLIKQNFRRFLEVNPIFKDYNFEGSGLSVLLDILAYNTHYASFYANMVANEMFLDSAIKRDSVVSKAKELGYTPTSTQSASAIVNISFTSGVAQGADYTLPAGTVFLASKDGQDYNFRTLDSVTVNTSTNPPVANNVTIVEGQKRRVSYIFDSRQVNPRFEIPDELVDTRYLDIKVQKSIEDITGKTDTWTQPADFNIITPTDKVYFIQEGKNSRYEIYFGDGILGQALEDGNVITITYFTSSGSDANFIGFTDDGDDPSFSIQGLESITTTVSVVSASQGGADQENTFSIKNNASKFYQSHDRCVTARDYEVMLAREYPYASSVFAWGGEDANPPEYGKVFISVVPKGNFIITKEEKNYIKNSILKRKNLVTVIPEIVDPDYTYLLIDSTVFYDEKQTNNSKGFLESLIKLTIIAYDAVNLEKFDKDFRFSSFVSELDRSSQGILSNTTAITMQKRLVVEAGKPFSYTTRFYNPIYRPKAGIGQNVVSEVFSHKNSNNAVVSCYIEDDGNGLLHVYSNYTGTKTIIVEDVGTVDYDSGTVKLIGFNPVQINGTTLNFTAKPFPSTDILTVKGNLLKIDLTDANALKVKAVPFNNVNRGQVNIFGKKI
jgi:hypothetical protein